MRPFYYIIFCLLSLNLYSQEIPNPGGASVSGQIIDHKTGETMPGVTIMAGSKNTATDINGYFKLSDLQPGEHNLIIKMIGYGDKTIKIRLNENEELKMSVKMDESSASLNEVVIEGETRKESLTAMMLLQKNSITVSDGIAGDVIKKSPDKNTGDVLKRISGTTIQNNKFVVIRGLNERYNTAFIDGTPLPSSESDKKAFAFDIFPSSILESISVSKSASPDLPSDFSGGVIRISTKTIPDSAITSITASTGFVPGSTFSSYYTYSGGKTDLLGRDDGARSLPDLAPTDEARNFNNIEKANQARLLNNNWALKEKSMAAPNSSLQVSHGNVWKFGNLKAGFIAGVTYSYGLRTTLSTRKDFDAAQDGNVPVQLFELNDTDNSENILAGAFGNFAIRVGKNHNIHFRNLFTENAEDKVVRRNGIRDYAQDVRTEEISSLRSYTQNEFFMNQIAGESNFPSAGIIINWNTGRGEIERTIPSLKRMVYSRSVDINEEEPSTVFEASIPTSGTSPSSGGNIFHSRNNEVIRSGFADISKKIVSGKVSITLKAGGSIQERERTFESRQFGLSRYSQGSKVVFDRSLLYLPEDKIFAEENMGIIQPFIPAAPGQPAVKGVGGFKLEESTKLNDSYTAGSLLKAAFIMQDFKFKELIRLSGGARYENYNQHLETFEDDGDTIKIDTTLTDILPSVNFVLSPGSSMNIRLSYGQTVSRPEFRELAPFGFYDFVSFYSVRGNPVLKRALIHNYDIRFEYFGGRNQMVSASLFYKKYIDPIEQINRVDVPREVFFMNVPEGINYGAEIEFRVGLYSLLPENSKSMLNNLFFTSNIALIKSEVNVDSVQGAISSKRSLQGQSPYVINGGISYQDSENGWMINALVNQVGRRLAIVGNTQEPDTYEHTRLVLDLQIEKKLKKNISVKAGIRDALAQPVIFYQDTDNNGKLDFNSQDLITSEARSGTTITAGISLSF